MGGLWGCFLPQIRSCHLAVGCVLRVWGVQRKMSLLRQELWGARCVELSLLLGLGVLGEGSGQVLQGDIDKWTFPSLPPNGDPPAICEISPLVSYSGEVRAAHPYLGLFWSQVWNNIWGEVAARVETAQLYLG